MKITSQRRAMRAAVASIITLEIGSVSAHGPKTASQVAEFLDRQTTAYHCAPQIAVLEAARKRSFAQRVLGGDPTSHQNLFAAGYFEPSGIEAAVDQVTKLAAEQGKQLMACEPVQETKIKNNTCVLAPEVTEGPYYHSVGHPVRANMAEWQLGLLFMMNIGVIDVETCEPVPNILVDLWHANATGYYAGHPTPRPDLVKEEPASTGPRAGLLSAYPRTVQEETWLRGALPTDRNGVAEFTSVFPGYYQGRATHVHVKVFPDWEMLPNGTFTGGRLIHTGQFFVDDHINQEVDKIYPYTTNPLASMVGRKRTRNWEDSLSIYQHSHEGGYMPTFEIEKLGGVLQQGLIGYVTMGVNMSATFEGKWNPTTGRGS
jgi:protocatechuate 3,4-dioxygenase beta subunit